MLLSFCVQNRQGLLVGLRVCSLRLQTRRPTIESLFAFAKGKNLHPLQSIVFYYILSYRHTDDSMIPKPENKLAIRDCCCGIRCAWLDSAYVDTRFDMSVSSRF